MTAKPGVRRSGDDEGAALVEFALIFPLFALMLFAIVQFGLVFTGWDSIRSSVQEATRLIALNDLASYPLAGSQTSYTDCTAAAGLTFANGTSAKVKTATDEAICTVQYYLGSPVGANTATPTISMSVANGLVTVCTSVPSNPVTGFFGTLSLSTTSQFTVEDPTLAATSVGTCA